MLLNLVTAGRYLSRALVRVRLAVIAFALLLIFADAALAGPIAERARARRSSSCGSATASYSACGQSAAYSACGPAANYGYAYPQAFAAGDCGPGPSAYYPDRFNAAPAYPMPVPSPMPNPNPAQPAPVGPVKFLVPEATIKEGTFTDTKGNVWKLVPNK